MDITKEISDLIKKNQNDKQKYNTHMEMICKCADLKKELSEQKIKVKDAENKLETCVKELIDLQTEQAIEKAKLDGIKKDLSESKLQISEEEKKMFQISDEEMKMKNVFIDEANEKLEEKNVKMKEFEDDLFNRHKILAENQKLKKDMAQLNGEIETIQNISILHNSRIEALNSLLINIQNAKNIQN